MQETAAMARAREPEQAETLGSARASIRAANQALLDKTADRFELPISVLIEQRDQALQQNEELRHHARGERAALIAEQDQFITFLMTDHEAKLVKLAEELKSAREALARQRNLESPSTSAVEGAPAELTDVKLEVFRLKDLLEAAYAEADETRADAARLQAELDDAVRAADDIRLEVRLEVDAARDDAFRIQSQLDETNRLLEDARDQLRDEGYRFTEELDDARRELDDRVAEVRRLRGRLTELDETRHSLPPPPAMLDTVRSENQLLRKQLIDAKRELSRVSRELELSNTRRYARPTPAPGRSSDALESVRRPTPNPTEPKPD
jgi:hypothetical protein